MGEATEIVESAYGSNEPTRKKEGVFKSLWVFGLLLVAACGAAWALGSPEDVGNLVVIEVADKASLNQCLPNQANRIPVKVTNRSNGPIRIVGNNAC